MIKFFEPSAFIIEERKETANVWDLRCRPIGAEARFGHRAETTSSKLYPTKRQSPRQLPTTPGVAVDGKDPFIVMITSGTTGFPKGCVIDHETYALRSLNNAISRGVNDRERGLIPLPLHFNAGRGSAMSLIYLGGTAFSSR